MNDALSEKRKRFIINFVYFAIILLLAYFALKYAIFAVMPFVIAFLVSWVLKDAPVTFSSLWDIFMSAIIVPQ